MNQREFSFPFLKSESIDELNGKLWIGMVLRSSSKTQCWQYRAGTDGSENKLYRADGFLLWKRSPIVTKLFLRILL